ncbi:MAG: hypothetical protein K5912_02975 [Alphaproteobacteria bacterium]|nr:hypothetical protein [Alphaproteobacteria bacterium]
MKKLILFCSLLCGIIFTGGAWAEEVLTCPAAQRTHSGADFTKCTPGCFKIRTLFDQQGYNVEVFFDSGKAWIKGVEYGNTPDINSCKPCHDCLKEFLESKKNTGVAGFIVVGSTSANKFTLAKAEKLLTKSEHGSSVCGEHKDRKLKINSTSDNDADGNMILGCLRDEYVVKNILPDWATSGGIRWGNDENTTNYSVQVFDMAFVNDYIFNDNDNFNDNDPNEISTSFYVVPTALTCKQQQETLGTMKDAIEAFIEKFPDKLSPKSKCRALLGYCKNFGDLDFLTIDQIKDENNCVEELLKLFKEDPVVEEQAPQSIKEVVIKWTLLKTVDTEYDYLSILLDNKNLSVWKDAQGKFNKSRFLSDTIAAVVLGTTSGVVTATLVKKNQIKKGFESLQCKIGGYKVADWGDSFMVGMTMR